MDDKPQVAHQLELVKSCLAKAIRSETTLPIIVVIKSGALSSGIDEINVTAGEGQTDQTFTVKTARGPLEMRQVLSQNRQTDYLAILTPMSDHRDLGAEVRGRIYRNRIQSLDAIDTVLRLFSAARYYPVKKGRTLIEAFLSIHTAAGSPRLKSPPSGNLDESFLWREILRFGVQLEAEQLDIVGLMSWCETHQGNLLAKIPEAIRSDAVEQIIGIVGPAAKPIMQMVGTNQNHLVVPLATACRVLYGEETTGTLSAQMIAARTRLEPFTGGKPLSVQDGRRLGEAGELFLLNSAYQGDPENLRKLIHRCEALLATLHASEFAFVHPLLPIGWQQKLDLFAETILAVLESTNRADMQQAEEAFDRLTPLPISVARAQSRLDQAFMALRLLRWLVHESSGAERSNLVALAIHYRDHLAWVDRARYEISWGDDSQIATEAYSKLAMTALARRDVFSRQFAEAAALQAVTADLPIELIGIESVLDKVAVPRLRANEKILMLVMDGLSWPITHRLIEDLRDEHWETVACSSNYQEKMPIMLATIPTVTHWSRSSLMAGDLVKGTADLEKRVFASHSGLVHASGQAGPPLVFHKKLLTDSSRGAKLRDELEHEFGSDRKMIAVVINAIDDRLSGATQQHDDWSLRSIRPLARLIAAARDSHRTIILVSDHGHVWHSPAALRSKHSISTEEGQRHRYRSAEALADEVTVTGPRVLQTPDQKGWQLAATEGLYHGTSRNGYHGGITPQELLAPLLVLKHRPEAGQQELAPPVWWHRHFTPEAMDHGATVSKPPAKSILQKFWGSAPTRANAPLVIKSDWVSRLFDSAVFKNQRSLIRAQSLTDEKLRQLLTEIERCGYQSSVQALLSKIGEPHRRSLGFFNHVTRLLNVEGYEILLVDHERDYVRLDFELLQAQFGLDEGRS